MLRPHGWTSADAAGLPILPGLLRYDEVRAGHVDHAIRFTTDVTDRRFMWPARHQAGSVANPTTRRWERGSGSRPSFPVSSYRADTRVVLQAMKRLRPGARRQRLAVVLPGRPRTPGGRPACSTS